MTKQVSSKWNEIMTKSTRLQNSYQWSSSRESTFQECQKKYWYTYYGAWDGWPIYYNDPRGKSVDPLSAHLYMLKNMQPMAVFIGSTVHKIIESVLKPLITLSTKKLPAIDALLSEGKNLFLKGLSESKAGLWKKHPKKHTHLLEDYYNLPLEKETIDASTEKVLSCLKNWYESPCIQNIALDPRAAWQDIEQAMTFEVVPGINAIVVFDFSLKWQKNPNSIDPITMIFDWKTGQDNQKIEEQLYAYALAANRLQKTPIDSILLVPFFLNEGPNGYRKIGAGQIEAIQPEKLTRIEKKIVTSSEEMLKFHTVSIDANGASTKPNPENFQYTADRGKCRRCPFLEVCDKAQFLPASIEELRKNYL